MKRPIELLMFDLDGTLADTGPDLADAVNYTRAKFHLAPLPDAQVYTYVGYGVEHLLRQSLPEGEAESLEEVMRVFLKRYEKHLLDKTVLYPNVREMLDYFDGKRKVVVTNKLRRLAIAIVQGLGIESKFAAILGGDSVPEKKPHPAPLNEVLERFQVPAAKAVIVGDGDTDMEAGKRAGVITCGVTYGLGNKRDLLAAEPDFVIDDLAQMSHYFF